MIASVAFYPGGAIDKHLDEPAGVRTPLTIHLDEQGEFISPEGPRAVADVLGDNDLVRI